jgi:hypothetical protein
MAPTALPGAHRGPDDPAGTVTGASTAPHAGCRSVIGRSRFPPGAPVHRVAQLPANRRDLPPRPLRDRLEDDHRVSLSSAVSILPLYSLIVR